MTGSAIRLARRADLPALVALESAFPEEDRFDRRTWRRLLGGQTAALVHESGGLVDASAVLLFRQGSDIARLYSLAVDPAARGRGLGARLLSACEDQARQRGARALRLEVRGTNSSAHRLYESAGYRVIARVESYYPDGEAARRMEKVLIASSDGIK